MRRRLLLKVVLIFVLFLVSLYISLPSETPIKIHYGPVNFEAIFKRYDIDIKLGKFEFKRSLDLALGLDLAGGAHLVFEADTSKVPADKAEDALDSAKEVVERRVNLFGVSEPSVVTSSFEGKERIIVELPGISDTKEAVDLIGKTAQLLFAEIDTSVESGTIKPTDLTGADLERAQVVFDQSTGKPAVSLIFTKEGGIKFEQITERNIGKPLAIFLDNQLVSAPTVQEKITGSSAQISGEFTLEEARNLTIQLNAGALPLPLNLIEERTIGPTLGKESIEKSINAGIVGVFMVAFFMTLAYGKMGAVSTFGLLIFATLTLAIYKLIPIVLTLPGIAGFLLSVGMAVDSNILVFERFKEEKTQRDLSDALEVSFGRAWEAIRDANIATLVTAFVLANPFDWEFLHTSGPVRGFAITLALGIGISLFTGVLVLRNLLRLFIKEKT